MAEISGNRGNQANSIGWVGIDDEEDQNSHSSSYLKADDDHGSSFCVSLPFFQKLMAEMVGTYFLIFTGCASIVVNISKDEVVTLCGIAMVWGLVVMVMVYAVGHISGAHFNPAVTIAFATCGRFPWKQVPAYITAQILGSALASGALRIVYSGNPNHFFGTLPSGSELQSLATEIIITFSLMFVISGVATGNRAIGELAGPAIGATILVNVIFAGPISGASMNPARSIGPAIVSNHYKGLWIYMIGPLCGAIFGAWAYNIIHFMKKPLHEITRSGSLLGSLKQAASIQR